jgi:hypothetical protein
MLSERIMKRERTIKEEGFERERKMSTNTKTENI